MPGMSAWLDPLRQALDESDGGIDFFFRDDDVGWATNDFRALLNCFRRYSVPLDIAAIPIALTEELADEICMMRDETPAAIGIHQHGFSHANHEAVGRKCEFGISRSGREQYRDIQRGKVKLEQMLGSALDPIFTPPWNRCTEITSDCLRELGFGVLSRDATARSFAASGLKELPISIDWLAKKKGSRVSLDCLGTAMANLVKQGKRPVGVMLHHELMDTRERHLLGELLALLTAHRHARCKLMSEIAGEQVDAGKELSP